MKRMIGSGAYGVVKKVGSYAVKKLPSESFESAIREIAYMCACSHPNFIQLISMDVSIDEVFYLKMKLFTFDLRKYLNMRIKMLLPTMYAIAHDIINAVDYLHSRGIIHCDICPSNILVDMNGETIINVTLCDLGIAVLDCNIAHCSHVQTYLYRAPEVYYHSKLLKFSKHIDIWSVGCILFEIAFNDSFHPYSQTEDTSIYIAQLMNIVESSQYSRVQLLNDITPTRVRKYITDRISFYTKIDCISDEYIDLFVSCLIPNIKLRIDSVQLLIAVNKLINQNCINSPNPITFKQYDADDMYCLTNINMDIVAKCPHETLIYAENLYRSCIDIMSITYNTQLACIYIATCIYSAVNIVKELITISDMVTIKAEVMRITITTVGKLICSHVVI